MSPPFSARHVVAAAAPQVSDTARKFSAVGPNFQRYTVCFRVLAVLPVMAAAAEIIFSNVPLLSLLSAAAERWTLLLQRQVLDPDDRQNLRRPSVNAGGVGTTTRSSLLPCAAEPSCGRPRRDPGFQWLPRR